MGQRRMLVKLAALPIVCNTARVLSHMEPINQALLDILVCPKCRGKVVHRDGKLRCTDTACRLVYPIREGIPVMLIDEAIRADEQTA